MKRFLLACGLCTAVLAAVVSVFLPSSLAMGLFTSAAPQKENVLEALLDLPAPPPPNPLETTRSHDEAFYDPKNPPPDNAPIEDLIDYWSHFRENYRGILYFIPKPSARVVERLLSEGGPTVVQNVIDLLPDDKHTGDVVKQIYDDPSTSKEMKSRLKSWLTLNSSYFADDTERSASRVKDVDNYVPASHQNSLLALTRHDWDRARPVLDRLYSDASQPVSKALATWALYRHAMESGDLGDTDRYRGELMRMVENRSLPDGVRDMANDAIVREADFPGRDEWCWSLFEDETLVNMPYFTGLTTLVMYAPPDKYVAKMAEILKSNNKTVRTAAARNLITAMEREKSQEVIRALLPWLSDPNWIDRSADDSSRSSIVMSLQNIKMPESVPGLIAALDEKATRQVEDHSVYSNSNIAVYDSRAVNAMRAAANAMNSAAGMMAGAANRATVTASNVDSRKMKEETYYPLRDIAVRALAEQADARAVPALRRLLATTAGYQRRELISAIMACGGYSVTEQVDSLEKYARTASEILAGVETEPFTSKSNSNAYYRTGYYESFRRLIQSDEVQDQLGMFVASSQEPSDEIVRATVLRIEKLEPREPLIAKALREIMTTWKGLAVSAIVLEDLKTGKAESAAIVRLLSERKFLRDRLSPAIDEARNGPPISAGVAACLSEDANSYAAALDDKLTETRTALLACARLIRAELPLDKVAENLKSTDELLKTAAELYLESEDSPQARSIVYAVHPGEAKVLGATTFFKGRKDMTGPAFGMELLSLFTSVSGPTNLAPYYAYSAANSGDLQKSEERLQKEVKEQPDIVGIYAYQNNFIRIYKDKVVFSWEDDPSRYHERYLSADEFNRFKGHLTANRVSELKPFLSCVAGCGTARELLMLGKNGGSRVFFRSERTPEFFAGLEKILADFRAEPSAIKYALSKDVSGLELLFSSDELDAQTVWKQGSDLRIVVSNRNVREKVDEEIAEMQASEQDEDEATDAQTEPEEEGPETQVTSPSERMRISRQYDGFAWHHVENGRLGEATSQPAGVEYIPARDQLGVQPDDDAWKARSMGFEIRADSTGLYKLAGGTLIKLKSGRYKNPVVTPNGRWVIVDKFIEEEGDSLIRYNLLTNREYKVEFEGYGDLLPRCWVPGIGKFLVVAGYYEEGDYEPDDSEGEESPNQAENRFYTLDPQSGTLAPVRGEARPLAAQSFRSLQPTGKSNEFWAALPSRAKNESVVGVYDSRLFKFTPLLKLPKINFDSMDMWVDEAENKVYFVYSGHLLRVPLKTSQSK